ncbi:MAG: hypothetical protein ABIJ86_02465 [Spirochaetota bacterium]
MGLPCISATKASEVTMALMFGAALGCVGEAARRSIRSLASAGRIHMPFCSSTADRSRESNIIMTFLSVPWSGGLFGQVSAPTARATATPSPAARSSHAAAITSRRAVAPAVGIGTG